MDGLRVKAWWGREVFLIIWVRVWLKLMLKSSLVSLNQDDGWGDWWQLFVSLTKCGIVMGSNTWERLMEKSVGAWMLSAGVLSCIAFRALSFSGCWEYHCGWTAPLNPFSPKRVPKKAIEPLDVWDWEFRLNLWSEKVVRFCALYVSSVKRRRVLLKKN